MTRNNHQDVSQVTIDIIILAAGAGKRMRSSVPKVLQPLAGKPLIGHIQTTLQQMQQSFSLHIVTNGENELVASYCDAHRRSETIQYHKQIEQLGTAHAVSQAVQSINPDGVSVILYADVPLIRTETIASLIQEVSENRMALLTQHLDNPFGYGRVIRHEGKVTAIIEEKDANATERGIKEVNTGIMAIDNARLTELLPQINNQNQSGEYYLTDIIALAVENGIHIETCHIKNLIETQGVNTKAQLAKLERALQLQQAEALLEQGVLLADPNRFDLRGDLVVGEDNCIDINCLIQGTVTLGNRVHIGPNCVIGEPGQRVIIGDDVDIRANSIIESAIIEEDCQIGPFARIRPGTHLRKGAKIGNFVETKKSDIGVGAKVNHLSYIGDAHIGEAVNIGAGTITCNYDGVNKHQTEIGKEAFIGSNTALVAPVSIGEGSTIAAGSTINRSVDNKQLGIARSKQRNIDNWQRPEKK